MRLRSFFFNFVFAVLLLLGSQVNAQAKGEAVLSPQFQILGGMSSNIAIAGCCTSQLNNFDMQIIARLFDFIGGYHFEIGAATTSRWTEVSIGPSFYILGHAPSYDPSTDVDTKILRIVDWNLVLSSGVFGMIHATDKSYVGTNQTTPFLTGAAGVYLRSHVYYALNDRWTLGASVQISSALAVDYFYFHHKILFGPMYQF